MDLLVVILVVLWSMGMMYLGWAIPFNKKSPYYEGYSIVGGAMLTGAGLSLILKILFI